MATQSAAKRAEEAAKAAAQASDILKEIPSAPTKRPEVVQAGTLVMTYHVMADAITGHGNTGAVDAPGHISAKDTPVVTRADIEALGGDFEWLLRCQAIVEAGYAPIS